MQLILIMNTKFYENPFAIHSGSTVACAFPDTLKSHPFLQGQRRILRRSKRQLTIPK